MKKTQQKQETKLSLHQLRKLIREEYGRGIPDFATTNAASNCSEEMKGHLVRFIQQRTTNPVEQRQLYVKASESLKTMETEIKEVIEKHLLQFLYRT